MVCTNLGAVPVFDADGDGRLEIKFRGRLIVDGFSFEFCLQTNLVNFGDWRRVQLGRLCCREILWSVYVFLVSLSIRRGRFPPDFEILSSILFLLLSWPRLLLLSDRSIGIPINQDEKLDDDNDLIIMPNHYREIISQPARVGNFATDLGTNIWSVASGHWYARHEPSDGREIERWTLSFLDRIVPSLPLPED